MTQARALGGVACVDATITLTLLDSFFDPVVGAPAEDLWLETTLSGLVLCPGGSIADSPTDSEGQTTWSRALRAGGHSDREAGEHVIVRIGLRADPWATYSGDADIIFNSPDINGDLQVDLSDTVLFAQDFSGAYHYRSDFFYDGSLTLSDTILFAQALGARCD